MFLITKRRIFLCITIIALFIISIFLININQNQSDNNALLGGVAHVFSLDNKLNSQTTKKTNENYSERFQRPSKQSALHDKYSFKDIEKSSSVPVFDIPQDVIYAYYGILKEASNMAGYQGGCGSIGTGKLPYPYAYKLLTKEYQKKMSLSEFTDTFKGIGHITFLKIYPAYTPPATPKDTRHYMFEIEVITGPKEKSESYKEEKSYFAYYYGIVTVKYSDIDGWKIDKIDYLPEEFLCAPYHNWFYDAEAVVQIIYINNLKIADKIIKTEEKNGLIYIYAKGNGKEYRFDFVRLTNGHDILLHENVLQNGKWVETDLLTPEWKDFKLSVTNKDFKP